MIVWYLTMGNITPGRWQSVNEKENQTTVETWPTVGKGQLARPLVWLFLQLKSLFSFL
jgi:hypothetical protein